MRSILLAVLAFIALSLPARADWPHTAPSSPRSKGT